MYYTGIDLHREASFLTTIDQNDQIIKKANLADEKRQILLIPVFVFSLI